MLNLMKHVIVGIDSGKRAAVACIDLNGKIVHINNGLFVSLDWYVDNIKLAGSPVIIAGDKRRAQRLLEKLSAIYNAVIYTPTTDISVKRKKEFLTGKTVANLHERDALSAALTAYNAYANKLNQAERYARERDVEDLDRVKALVIKRYSIHEALEGKEESRRFARS